MWRFKTFSGKEPTGLEGRTVDIGSVKVYVRNVIAEGGFSCVYIARDAVHASRQYALKHMICSDRESLDLVMKEIQVMKLLKGHPNVVTLVAHAVLDMGRMKEAFLLLEFCEKSLVNMLESRGVGHFEEKQILLIFRDICNAVFSIHSPSPPIAHRDLKVENILLGSDGAWKLCDFGSTSTNHKCFERPEEMGIEEDIIRKHTTPAYRAPEMWDLYRREVISEKVDIWALGCLLYRICYLKSAFDGESKLQILNGNYRIPDLPQYSTKITRLIKDMLEASPSDRPDITQVWFRINEMLPLELQKNAPDEAPLTVGMRRPQTLVLQDEGVTKRTPMMPKRSPPPSREQVRTISPASERDLQPSKSSAINSKTGGAPIGAFWSTQHGQNTTTDLRRGSEKLRVPQPGSQPTFQNEAFNAFVAEFDTNKLHSVNACGNNNSEPRREGLEAEVNNLKEQLKKTNLEKAEITSKYEKLTAICHSQWQEIQELKRALVAATPSPPTKVSSRNHVSVGNTPVGTQQKEKIEGNIWGFEQGMFASSTMEATSDTIPWQAFPEAKSQTTMKGDYSAMPGAINGHQSEQANTVPSHDAWGFGLETYTVGPTNAPMSRSDAHGNSSQRFSGGAARKIEKPSGWAGF